MKKALVAGISSFLFWIPYVALAALQWHALVPDDCKNPGGCQSVCDIALLVQYTMGDAIILSTFVAAVLFAWSGFRMVTAGGDAHQITNAKKTFSAVFIGFLIILSAWFIVDTIMKTLMPDSGGFGPWNQICQP